MVYPCIPPHMGWFNMGFTMVYHSWESCCGLMFHQASPLTPTLRESLGPSTWRWQHGPIDANKKTIICIQLCIYIRMYVRIYIYTYTHIYIYTYIYIHVRIYIVCADKVQLCEANMQIACLVAVTPTPPLFVDTFGILVLLRYVNMITCAFMLPGKVWNSSVEIGR
jgi:hypothetical protein